MRGLVIALQKRLRNIYSCETCRSRGLITKTLKNDDSRASWIPRWRFLKPLKPLVLFLFNSASGVQLVFRHAAHSIVDWFKKHDTRGLRLSVARKFLAIGWWNSARKNYAAVLQRSKGRPLKLENRNEVLTQLSLLSRIADLDEYKQMIENYRAEIAETPPKIAIYTAISGGYDTLKLPAIPNPLFDYILFTDTPVKDSGIFQVRPLPYFHEDATRRARFVKTHPHQLLQGYDYAIWIDANIMTIEDIEPLLREFLLAKEPVGAIRHPLRDSIYEEAKECIKRSKEDAGIIQEQIDHYREEGFDCDDLIESNVMMFDLHDKRIPGFFATWWAEIDRYSKRDQLSLNYALQQNNINWARIMDRPHDARSHPYFTLAAHHTRHTALFELEGLLGANIIDPSVGPSYYAKRDEIISDKKLNKLTVDIVYCVHNALEDVKVCLESVVKHHVLNERLIIIDDGSDEDTRNFLRTFSNKYREWTKLIRSETGSGYTKAANRGLKASTADFVILLNSDTIVTRDWTAKMAHAVLSTQGGGIVGPLSSAASHQSIPNHVSSDNQTATNTLPPGITPDDLNKYCEHWSVANQYPRVPLVHGFCFGLTREVINKVGYFDEKNFAKGYGEENDYCFRAVDAGFGLVIATNTYIFHAKSKSYIGPERIKLMKSGNETLAKLRGKERIRRAIISVQKHPTLVRIRDETANLYAKIDSIYRKEKEHLIKVLKEFYSYSDDVHAGKINVDILLQKGYTKPTSSAFIRLISPLSHPSLRDSVALRIFESSDYAPDKNTDVCIVQRTAVSTLPTAVKLVDALKERGVKLIVDTDDAFTEIEESHPEYFAQKEKSEALQYVIENSNQLWTSTQIIADQYKNGMDGIYVIPNSIDERIWKVNTRTRQKVKSDTKLQFVYMGTSTHAQDLGFIMPILDKLYEKYPNSFELTLIGIDKNPVYRSWIKNITTDIPSAIYPEFVSWFQKQGPFDIGLAPLVDSRFNQAKSDIKCLDYLAIGALPVVSALNPYTDSDIRKYSLVVENTLDGWHRRLSEVLNDLEGFKNIQQNLVSKGQQYIHSERSSEQTSETLMKYLQSLR